MSPQTRQRILDALEACESIKAFLYGVDRTAYLGSSIHQAAVERKFEVIGESLNAANSLDPSLEEAVPELPRIVGLRNRLIHGYDRVDSELVWDVACSKLPELALRLRQLLD